MKVHKIHIPISRNSVTHFQSSLHFTFPKESGGNKLYYYYPDGLNVPLNCPDFLCRGRRRKILKMATLVNSSLRFNEIFQLISMKNEVYEAKSRKGSVKHGLTFLSPN